MIRAGGSSRIFLAFWAILGSVTLHAEEPGCGPLLIEQGVVIQVDLVRNGLRVVGRLHPAAPTAARAPDDLIWGRRGERELAALDPATGEVVAAVALPMRPYDHLIAPNGKAYVTHHTLTKEGFWVSVVDTRERRLIATIRNIAGLQAGLAAAGRYVFLTTVDVQEEGSVRLYAIDTERDTAREILREPKGGTGFSVCGHGNLAYLVRAGESGCAVDVLDPDSGKCLRRVGAENPSQAERFTGRMLVCGSSGYVPCSTAGGPGVAVFDFATERVVRVHPQSDPVRQVLGVAGDMLAGSVQTRAGDQGTTLLFYNLRAGKEVKRISIPEFLQTH